MTIRTKFALLVRSWMFALLLMLPSKNTTEIITLKRARNPRQENIFTASISSLVTILSMDRSLMPMFILLTEEESNFYLTLNQAKSMAETLLTTRNTTITSSTD